MQKSQKLLGFQRSQGVCLSIVVTELHVEDPVLQDFDDGANLTLVKGRIYDVFGYSDNVQNLQLFFHIDTNQRFLT